MTDTDPPFGAAPPGQDESSASPHSDSIQALLRKAVEHHQAGRLAQAAEGYRQVLQRAPEQTDALNLLGILSYQGGQRSEGLMLMQKAVALATDNAGHLFNYACALQGENRKEEALALLRKAAELAPEDGGIRGHLGLTLLEEGSASSALPHLDAAIREQPEDAGLRYHQARALLRGGQLSRAVEHLRRAVELAPNNVDAKALLGITLARSGEVAEGCGHLASLIEDHALPAWAHSHYLSFLSLLPQTTPQDLATAQALWVRRHAPLSERPPGPFPPDVEARPLRVGLLSADFRTHPYAFFVASLLQGFDPKVMALYCYADLSRPDAMTEQLRHLCQDRGGIWLETRRLADSCLAERIQNDGIDILIDLTGHGPGNRLPLLAQRLAPLQMTWLGGRDGTGIPAFDYVLTDACLHPDTPHLFTQTAGEEGAPAAQPGNAFRTGGSEQAIRLPQIFACYTPPTDAPINEVVTLKHHAKGGEQNPVAVAEDRASHDAPPSTEKGITFASLNALPRLSSMALDCWAAILHQCPESRLLIVNRELGDQGIATRLRDGFLAKGIGPDRLELLPETAAFASHHALYHRIDIALDSFPCNGTATVCEALWMGVPIVTLAAPLPSGRVGKSLLTQIGLEELVADTPEDYVALAVRLARDEDRRRTLQQDLRRRMQASALCDPQSFARDVENALWARWRVHCVQNQWAHGAQRAAAGAGFSVPGGGGGGNAPDTAAAQEESQRWEASLRNTGPWRHRFKLAGGLRSPGLITPDATLWGLPDQLEGRRVLDVGPIDGFWGLECLRRHAMEVVAIDGGAELRDGPPDWRAYDLCRDMSGVEPRFWRRQEGDLYEIDPALLGRFNLLLLMDGLGGLRHPLLALERLAAVAAGPLLLASPLWQPYEGLPERPEEAVPASADEGALWLAEIQDAHGQYRWQWQPSLAGLAALVRAAGFREPVLWRLPETFPARPQGPDKNWVMLGALPPEI